jgi:hypothetical protein
MTSQGVMRAGNFDLSSHGGKFKTIQNGYTIERASVLLY